MDAYLAGVMAVREEWESWLDDRRYMPLRREVLAVLAGSKCEMKTTSPLNHLDIATYASRKVRNSPMIRSLRALGNTIEKS